MIRMVRRDSEKWLEVRLIDATSSTSYEIVWYGSGRGALSDSTLSDIRKREPSVQSLRIQWRGPSTVFLYLLPSCFPALQFLSLKIFPAYRQRMPPPPDTFLMGCSLFELRLFGVPHDFFSGFFRSQNVLQVLEFPCIASSQFLEAILPSLCNLRSLRLRRFTQILLRPVPGLRN
ncbi:hypothetical protein FA13DRAFT_1855041 [Coprinellus micaceus]|uniref:F-box domain-containing protein n=1 Tax=Coprinellus micaceus TaxID=71717 RepID=A0A4Y7T958_COPMI|nr:hypothetical protein FA13DRAFT_1855041 [Coprinellus micaceus]